MNVVAAKRQTTHPKAAFTIVELLIVIVVIAILAAISIVAYTGIQNRANDSSIQNDLAALSKSFELFRVDDGAYPDSVTNLGTLNAKVNKSAYLTSPDVSFNLIVFIHPSSNPTSIAVLASSKSGNRFYALNGGAPVQYTGAVSWSGTNHGAMCSDLIPGAAVIAGSSSGYGSSAWRSWVN